MAGIWGVLLITAASIIVFRYVYRLIHNYISASKTGLPFLVIPLEQNHPIWMVASVMLRPWMKKYLPTSLWDRLKYTIYGWESQEKLAPFHPPEGKTKYADESTFVLSTFGRFEIWTANPSVISQILSRPNDFQQLDLSSLFMGQFGNNLLISDGEVWSRHRKVVASAVSERISPVVWVESIEQTEGLLQEIFSQTSGKPGETIRLYDMLKTVTIHVLSKAGMGVGKEWTAEAEDTSDAGDQGAHGEKEVSYMDAVKLLNDYLTGPIIIPSKALVNWPSFLPGYKGLRRLGLAKVLFPLRTQEMLTEEKKRVAEMGISTERAGNNIMRNLIAASEASVDAPEKQKITRSGKKTAALTDEELISNLYVFTAAGYDTTANTLAFAVTLLMRYPKWQDWLFEEVDAFLASKPDMDEKEIIRDYQAIFPKCNRILALMYETVRLFSPLIHMTKMVKSAQTLTMNSGKQVVLPAGTSVYVNTIALHLNANIWRDLNLAQTDEKEAQEKEMPGRNAATAADYKCGGGKLGDEWRFRPTRWIVSNASSTEGKSAESLYQPPRGAFLAWSMGPRVCPGQRMSQVEFTAIMLTILSKYRLEAVAYKDESHAEVMSRLDHSMQNAISKLTLEMVDVYDRSRAEDKIPGSQIDKAVGSGLRVRLINRRA